MAALTFVQATTGIVTATTLGIAYSSNTTAGSYLLAVVGVRVGAGNITSVTSPGNTWTQIGSKITTPAVNGTAQDVYLYQCANNVTNGAQTVTFHASLSSTMLGGIVEFTNQSAGTPLDASNSNVGSGSGAQDLVAAAVIASQTNEEIIVIGNVNVGGVASSSDGFIVPAAMSGTQSGSLIAYIAQSVPGSYSEKLNSSGGGATDYGLYTLAVKSSSSLAPVRDGGGGIGSLGLGLGLGPMSKWEMF